MWFSHDDENGLRLWPTEGEARHAAMLAAQEQLPGVYFGRVHGHIEEGRLVEEVAKRGLWPSITCCGWIEDGGEEVPSESQD